MLSHKSHISLTTDFGDLGWFKFRQRDHLIVRVTVADVGRELQVKGVGGLGLFQSQHARVQIQISEEDHIIDHEAEKWPQLVLRGQHELLTLAVDDSSNLLLDSAGLL